MSAKVIHVDFRARKVIAPRDKMLRMGAEERLQAVLDSIAVPESLVPAPRPNFLEPEHYVYGSKYMETRDLPIKDIAKVVRAYCRDTYPKMKFSVRSGADTMAILVTNPGPVPVYKPRASADEDAAFSDTMTEILNDVEAFVQQFNCDHGNPYADEYRTRMYVFVTVRYSNLRA